MLQPTSPADFLDGLVTVAGSGDAAEKRGVAIHVFHATKSMQASFFNADGDLLLVPQQVRALFPLPSRCALRSPSPAGARSVPFRFVQVLSIPFYYFTPLYFLLLSVTSSCSKCACFLTPGW
jgi:hypothetical protein